MRSIVAVELTLKWFTLVFEVHFTPSCHPLVTLVIKEHTIALWIYMKRQKTSSVVSERSEGVVRKVVGLTLVKTTPCNVIIRFTSIS